MRLETERLILRPFKDTDAQSLYEYAKDERVGPSAGWLPHTGVENSREIIRTILSAPETYAVCLKEDDRAIGSIGLMIGKQSNLKLPETDGEIGYWIGMPFWGRGLIPEAVREMIRHAFLDLNLKTLWCGYFDGNERSRRVQEKCGFVYDHTNEDVYWKPLDRTLTERVTRLGREAWDENAAAQHPANDRKLTGYAFVTLRDRPELMHAAAEWFHSKWGVPKEAYLSCMTAYLRGETEYGWYLCLAGNRIAGGLGIIENDFHDRKDLAPNVCAVYTEEAHRKKGIAGKLLDLAVRDMRSKGISPLYLVTDHTGFYERYGWEFLCMVQGDGEPEMTRMYIHR